MTTEANKELLRRYKVEILNNRDLQALDQVAAADYLDHVAFPGQAAGLEGLKQRIATLFEALDPQWTIHDTIAEDDMVVLRWSHAGTHRAEFLGIPPTGKTFVLRGIDMYRVRNGKIAEHWNVVDLLGFRQQVSSLCAGRAGSAVERRVGFWQVLQFALAVAFLRHGRNHLGDLAGAPQIRSGARTITTSLPLSRCTNRAPVGNVYLRVAALCSLIVIEGTEALRPLAG
jgi:steroid delta-isomerase-like uncharacterized protein